MIAEMRGMISYRVAVFPYRTKTGNVRCHAYLRDYSPEWKGCNMIEVSWFKGDGKMAKRIAILELKERIQSGQPVEFADG